MSHRCLSIVLIVVAAMCAQARGQALSSQGSGVKAYFASQSDAYHDSDPTGAIWGIAGLGPYTFGSPIAPLPGAPAPGISPAGGNSFSGAGWASSFNDGVGTNALSIISDSYLGTPTQTADTFIAIPFWTVQQNASAIGYTYDQLNFGSNYLVTTNPGVPGTASPNIPLFVFGNVIAPGNYAQFNGVVNYDWTPANINTTGVIAATGPTVNLGSLNYSFLQNTGGTFAANVPSVSSGLAAIPPGDGILSLTGEMWIAGDPFSMTVTPEPASISLLGLAILALLRRRRRALLA